MCCEASFTRFNLYRNSNKLNKEYMQTTKHELF
jgi:hypothetical protein